MRQETYTNFIAKHIPEKMKISLLKPITIEGESCRYSTKLGLCANKSIQISVNNIYSRSVEIIITWDKATKKFLVYCPTNKSPEEFYYDLRNTCSKKVNEVYTDDELLELQSNYRNNIFKNLKK